MIPPNDLIRNLDSARDWAEFLTGNRPDADDAVQEACLAAIRSDSAAPVHLGLWIRKVLRLTVLQSFRTERRRRRREAEAARQATISDPTDDSRRADRRRAVRHAVARLAEPYRSTVIARYYEALTPTAIAARDGTSVHTVKTRLKRAHHLLRDRLEHRVDRRALAGGPIPALFLRPAAQAVAASLLLGAGAILLVVADDPASLMPRMATTDGSVREKSPRLPEATSITSDSRTAAEARPAPGAAAPTSTPAAFPAGIHGRVMDEAGAPVAAALVTLADPVAVGPSLREHACRHFTTTDARGRYRLPFRDGVRAVQVTAEGFAMGMRMSGASRRLDFVLSAPHSLRGVVRMGGKPTQHVRVFLHLASRCYFRSFGPNGSPRVRWIWPGYAHTTTDESGRYRFDGIASDRYHVAIQTHSHPAIQHVAGVVEVTGDATRDFRIPPPAKAILFGRVRDRDTGRPITTARVFAAFNPRHGAKTAPDGTFRLEGVGGPRLPLCIQAPGYVPICRAFDFTSGTDPRRDFLLRRTRTVYGQVVDSQGNPIARARVSSCPGDPDGGATRPIAVTDENGAFRLGGIDPDASACIRASAPGFGPTVIGISGHAGGKAPSHTVVLRPGGTVMGLLRARAGGRRHLVTLRSVSGGDARCGGGVRPVRTDANGRFRFADVPPGRYGIAAWLGSQYHTFESEVTVVSGLTSSLDLTATDDRHIAGRICDGKGQPVGGIRIEACSPNGRIDVAVSDSDGSFRLIGLDAAPYTLRTRTQGRHRTAKPVTVTPPASDLGLLVQPRASISGRVIDGTTGHPVERFWIRIVPYSGRPSAAARKRYFASDEGAFVIDAFSGSALPVPDGPFELEAGSDDSRIQGRVSGVQPGDTGVRIVVRPGATIRGTVDREEGRTGSPTVMLALAGGGWRRRDADGEGSFAFRAVPPGHHTIEAFDGSRVAVRRIHARAGLTLRLGLRPTPGVRVDVTTTTIVGAPLAGVRVSVRRLGTSSGYPANRAQATGALGGCRFDGLPPGEYEVRAERKGHRPAIERILLVSKQARRHLHLTLTAMP